MKRNNKEITSSLNTIAKTSLIILVGLFLSKLFTYGYRIIAARYFGPEAYGLFSISIMIMGWFAAFASLGLADGLLRYIAMYRAKNQDAKARGIFKKSMFWLTVTGILGGMIMFSLAGTMSEKIFHNQNLEIFIQIFSIGVPLITIATPLISGIRAFERVNAQSAIYNILQNGIKVFAIVAFIFFGFGEQSISFSYLLGLMAVLIASYIYARRKLPEMIIGKSECDKSSWNEVMTYSWPLMFYGIISTILYWIDSFSIGYFKDAVAVGWYNAAVPIALLIGISPEIFSNLFFPMINRFYAIGKKNTIAELGKQVTKWIFLVNFPIFLMCFVFPEAIINILFGSEYIVAAQALRILSIGVIISSLGTVPTHLVSMVGKSKLLMFNIIIASIMNLILNSIFVPMEKIWFIDNSIGINGAALATVISFALFAMLYFVQAYKYTGIIPIRRKLFGIILSGIIPVLGLVYVKGLTNLNFLQLVGIGIIFLTIYVMLLFLTKSVDRYDKEIISKIMNKFRLK